MKITFSRCLSDATCTWADLQSISPPAFLIPSMSEDDVIPAGLWISFTCTPGSMVPAEVDPDSNYALEVYCVDGLFVPPTWPTECEEENVCVNAPNPPTENVEIVFERSDNRTKYRIGQKVYFTCNDEDAKAIVDDGSGLNAFGVACPEDLVDFPQVCKSPENSSKHNIQLANVNKMLYFHEFFVLFIGSRMATLY